MTEQEQEQLLRAVETRELPYFFTLDRAEQLKAVEALIFASEEPLTTRMLQRVLVLEDPQPVVSQAVAPTFDVPKDYFDELVEMINEDLVRTTRPYRIVKIAGGFQFATTPTHGQLVQRLLKAKNRKRLTQAALETIAIIAYRQPITKAEVDAIRGVNAGEVVNSLVEKQLVAMVGRSETIGKPLLYGTTEEFLRIFGLNSLSDLPKLREIDDLIKTTTTMVDLDESISIRTDHKTLRKQLALLLEESADHTVAESDNSSTDTTPSAYWHHSMENEAERGLVEDPEPGIWEKDAERSDVDNSASSSG